MNPHTEIKRITEELRAIYRNTNEGPRLIAEMIKREFPNPRRVINGPHVREGAGNWGPLATDVIR